jgi:hypothetical protein
MNIMTVEAMPHFVFNSLPTVIQTSELEGTTAS